MKVDLPPDLVAAVARHGKSEGYVWLDRLAERVAAFADRWDLVVGPPFVPGGHTSWTAPAGRRGTSGEHDLDLVLKVGFRHDEALHEPDALLHWDGEGAVRLLEADRSSVDDTVALLLERCLPGTLLRTIPEAEQDLVLTGLLRRLWHPPPAGSPYRPLALMCSWWADEHDAKVASHGSPLDASVRRAGIDLLRTLPHTSDRNVLLCTDLHAGNILAAEREPWLVIDPKPYVGDPAYDLTQHCLNCERLTTDPIGLVNRLAGLSDLDPERVRLWLFARCVQESPGRPDDTLVNAARLLAP